MGEVGRFCIVVAYARARLIASDLSLGQMSTFGHVGGKWNGLLEWWNAS